MTLYVCSMARVVWPQTREQFKRTLRGSLWACQESGHFHPGNRRKRWNAAQPVGFHSFIHLFIYP